MQKTPEQLEARKLEIIKFLSKHYQKDPAQLENFISKYPNYSENNGSVDESSEANEFADYEQSLAVEQALENELEEIETELAK